MWRHHSWNHLRGKKNRASELTKSSFFSCYTRTHFINSLLAADEKCLCVRFNGPLAALRLRGLDLFRLLLRAGQARHLLPLGLHPNQVCIEGKQNADSVIRLNMSNCRTRMLEIRSLRVERDPTFRPDSLAMRSPGTGQSQVQITSNRSSQFTAFCKTHPCFPYSE